MQDSILIERMVSANEVLEDVCALLPEGIPHEPVKDAIIAAFSGQRIYFPHRLRTFKRNAEIAAKFDGINWKAICVEYRISRAYLYIIIKRHKIFNKIGRTVEP